MMAIETEYNEAIDFVSFIQLRIDELKQELKNAKYPRHEKSILDSIAHNESLLLKITKNVLNTVH